MGEDPVGARQDERHLAFDGDGRGAQEARQLLDGDQGDEPAGQVAVPPQRLAQIDGGELVGFRRAPPPPTMSGPLGELGRARRISELNDRFTSKISMRSPRRWAPSRVSRRSR